MLLFSYPLKSIDKTFFFLFPKKGFFSLVSVPPFTDQSFSYENRYFFGLVMNSSNEFFFSFNLILKLLGHANLHVQ